MAKYQLHVLLLVFLLTNFGCQRSPQPQPTQTTNEQITTQTTKQSQTSHNITGIWEGRLHQNAGASRTEWKILFVITQKHEQFEGTSRIEVVDQPEYYGLMKIRGTVSKSSIHFEETEIIEEKPLNDAGWLLKSGDISLITEKNGLRLEGSWAGRPARIGAQNGPPGTLILRAKPTKDGMNWPLAGLPSIKSGEKLSLKDFERASTNLQCEVACVRAIADVEGNGEGFLPSGKPKILFESHVFGKQTDGKYNSSHPTISSSKWDRTLYGSGGEHQYTRLKQAMDLDHQSALKSTSWGMFQIMGYHYKDLGYATVTDFVDDMYSSEAKQLDAFVKFLKKEGLDKPLREKKWKDFARGYNGKDYAKNEYDVKLQNAYEKYAK